MRAAVQCTGFGQAPRLGAVLPAAAAAIPGTAADGDGRQPTGHGRTGPIDLA